MNDDEFLKAFEDCTYPRDDWKHKAHVRMAWLYLSRHAFEVGLLKIREGIKRYNACSDNHGYKETETQFFVRMIHFKMIRSKVYEFEAFCLQNGDLFASHPPLRAKYYSDQVWRSEAAIHEFVEPDLFPLPDISYQNFN